MTLAAEKGYVELMDVLLSRYGWTFCVKQRFSFMHVAQSLELP